MFRSRRPGDPVIAAMLAAVASETCSYTDPRAGYPLARAYRAARAVAVERRHSLEDTDEA